MALEGIPLKLNEGTAEKMLFYTDRGSKQVEIVSVLLRRQKIVKVPQPQAWIDLLDLIRGHVNCLGGVMQSMGKRPG